MPQINDKAQQIRNYFEDPEKYLHKSFGVKIRTIIVEKLLGEIEDKDILDMGCGDGSVSLPFIEKNRLTFVDFSTAMLNIVRKKTAHAKNYRIVQSSIYEFRAEKKYDVILCIGLLAHLEDMEKAIGQLEKVLKTNGKLIIQFTNHEKFLTNLYYVSYSQKKLINKTFYSEMKHLVYEKGFKIEKEIKYGILLRGMGRLPDSFLFWFQKKTLESKLLRKFSTENIWLLTKKD